MAARNTRSPRATKEAVTGVSSVEGDLTPTKSLADFAGTEASSTGELSPAAVPSDAEVETLKAADEAAEIDAEVDAEQRAEQLSKFVTGDVDAAAEDIQLAPEIDVSTAKDFGGDTVALVIFDYYRLRVDGLSKLAKRGDLIKVSAEESKRGTGIGGLKKIEG